MANPTPNYNAETVGSLPSDATLKSQGFCVGDTKFTKDAGSSAYQIGQAGSATPAGFSAAGSIG